MDTTGTNDHAQVHAADSHSEGSHDIGHLVPVKYLVMTLTALLILTVVTVAASRIDLGGEINIILAVAIAAVKATIVALFFMHLYWDSKFNGFLFAMVIFTLAVFIGFLLMDTGDYRADMIWEQITPPK
ncbi:MAG: cytochrome C oxidase subunit IV family protein [Planctomycetes bacterium]|nr:cytochrome C oxidase subunit IV family protein [Planctomycetota bacterium]